MCILSAYVKTPLPNPERDSARAAVRELHGNYYDLDEDGKAAFLVDWFAIDDNFPRELATVADAVDHIDHIVESDRHRPCGHRYRLSTGEADWRTVTM